MRIISHFEDLCQEINPAECESEGERMCTVQLGRVTSIFKKENGSVAPAYECELSHDQIMPA